jgi:uncharacterized protein
MNKEICVISLPRKKSYAVISPHRIVYGLEASKKEMSALVEEEKKVMKNFVSGTNYSGQCLENDSVGIIPTFDCNLRCVYCYSKGGEKKKTMSLDVAKVAIGKNANDCSDYHNQLDIYLVGGGEPLLPFKLVCDMVDFARSVYSVVKIHVVTNGTFNEKVLDWLLLNKVDVRVSYDGVMHDVQRPFPKEKANLSSREVVKKNIKILASKNIPLTVQCIVSRNGLNSLRQTVDEIIEMGVKVLKIEPVLITDISRGKKGMEPDPIEYAEALLNIIKYTSGLNIDFRIDTGYFSEPSDEDYCGIRKGNKIFTPDGLITACVEVAKGTDPYANPIIFGKIEEKKILIDKNRLRLLESLHYKNQEKCVKCNLRLICQGGCPMANIWRSGFPPKNSLFTCSLEHKLIPNLLLEMVDNPRIAKVIFNDNIKMKFC